MGSPTIIAKVESPSPNSEIAARLLDVSPEGTESLVARGLYRPTGGSQEMVFQLHPQGYHFAAGHVAKLELLPSDFPYGRYSNLQSERHGLRPRTAPAGDEPARLTRWSGPEAGAEGRPCRLHAGGGIQGNAARRRWWWRAPAPKPTPAPVRIGAGGFTGKFSVKGNAIVVPVKCTGGGACSGKVTVRTKRSGAKGLVLLAKGSYSLAQGASKQVRLPLTKAGRRLVKAQLGGGRRSQTLAGVVQLNDSGRPMLTLNRPVHLSGGH